MKKYWILRGEVITLSDELQQTRDELHGLWDKHNRLLEYLELEDVTIPQEKVIRPKAAALTQEAENELS